MSHGGKYQEEILKCESQLAERKLITAHTPANVISPQASRS